MKEIKVTVNTWYVVEGAAGATVINPLTNRAIATVEDGKQASFLATTPYVVASDDSVNVFKAPFNSAPAKLKALGLLGGGTSELPAGYLRAEFLESSGTQYIDTQITATKDTNFSAIAELKSAMATVVGQNNVIYQDGYYCCAGAGALPVIYIRAGENQLGFGNMYMNYKTSFFIKDGMMGVGNEKRSYTQSDYKGKGTMFAFARRSSNNVVENKGTLRVWNLSLKNSEQACEFLPAIDPQGVPCMFDKVTKKPFYNSGTGSFIVGMDMKQALKLSRLLAGGGTLTVSLPSNYLEDEGVVNALATAQENGWVITIQTYEAETGAASTFSLRRIWVRKVENEQGSYVDTDGTRWQVEWCVDIVGADPEQEGYEPFRSVEAACEYWGLTPYIDPAWEEELLTEINKL